MNMDSIVNEIKRLDEYVKIMKKVEGSKAKKMDFDTLLLSIGYLKKWAGIDKDPRDYEKLIMGSFEPRFTPNDKIIKKMSLDIRESFTCSNPLQKPEATEWRLEYYLTEMLNSISNLNAKKEA